MPAAAVIPAPIAYINAVAVKKLVVGLYARMRLPGRLEGGPERGGNLASRRYPRAATRGRAAGGSPRLGPGEAVRQIKSPPAAATAACPGQSL